MSFIEHFLQPLIQLLVYLCMGGWVIFIVYKILKKPLRRLVFFLRHSVFRENYNEDYVQICMQFIESEMDDVQIKKSLLLDGYNFSQVDEIFLILKKIKKKMKGGKKDE